MKVQVVALCGIFYAGLGIAAEDVTLVGTVSQPVRPSVFTRFIQSGQNKTLSFLALQLSSHAQQALISRSNTAPEQLEESWVNASSSKQLGMNGVPVLNQGQHGTCVTFATTAAIDAALGLKDGISQLCQLQLGSYLQRQSYSPSGWDGSFGHVVLSQIETFGVVSKETEKTKGCNGLFEYPGSSAVTPTQQLSVEAFHRLSKEVDRSQPSWYPIFHIGEAFSRSRHTLTVLKEVKKAINEGDRVVFGTLLPDLEQGTAGAVGTHRAQNDTWVLTDQIKVDLEKTVDLAGHEMIITGYDDNAVVVDETGKSHVGLLTLRNSWGAHAGDRGDFYMSYDYFVTLVIEAHRIMSS